MADLFVSDVHVSAVRPRATEYLLDLLAGPALSAQRLFILGDFFDLWLGDDDDRPPHGAVTAALRDVSDAGVAVFFMHGNHDFLVRERFADAARLSLLPDPSVVRVAGRPVLLSHGDLLCTDDVDYQKFRAYARDPAVQREFLARDVRERLAQANGIRKQSQDAAPLKSADITDVNPGAVADLLRRYGVNTLIHGHTHRPAVHEFTVDEMPARRIVLGDWYRSDPVGVWDGAGYRTVSARQLPADLSNP